MAELSSQHSWVALRQRRMLKVQEGKTAGTGPGTRAPPRWRSFPSTSLLCGPAATCSWFSRSICPLISPALPPQPFLLREQPESLGSGIQILIAFKKKKIQRAKKHVQRALRAVMPFTTPALLATQTQSLQRELIKTATGIHKTGVTTQQAAC